MSHRLGPAWPREVICRYPLARWLGAEGYGQFVLETLATDPERLRILDQLLFRFTKWQDALGLRMVPATLKALSEPFGE